MHLALEVDTEKVVESTIERLTHEIRSFLKQEHIQYTTLNRVKGNQILIKLKGQKNIDGFEKILDTEFKNLSILSRSMDGDTLTMQLDLPSKEADQIKKLATDQALETIRNRIDQFGVSEPDIRRQGENRILVQLPGIKDTKRAKALIGKTALLEFKLLDEGNPLAREFPASINPDNEDAFYAEFNSKVPEGDEILLERVEDEKTGVVTKRPYLIKKKALMTGDMLSDARVSIGDYNEPYVSITLNATGARLFEKITGENIQKRLAIILDNHVYSAPVIQDKISGGRAQITGRYSAQEASDLAIVLRAGALPAPVKIIENRK